MRSRRYAYPPNHGEENYQMSQEIYEAIQRKEQWAIDLVFEKGYDTVHRYVSTSQHGDRDEIYSIAHIGYMKAIHSFNPNKNDKFQSYAWFCIRNQVVNFYRINNYKKNLMERSIQFMGFQTDESGKETSADPYDNIGENDRSIGFDAEYKDLVEHVLSFFTKGTNEYNFLKTKLETPNILDAEAGRLLGFSRGSTGYIKSNVIKRLKTLRESGVLELDMEKYLNKS